MYSHSCAFRQEIAEYTQRQVFFPLFFNPASEARVFGFITGKQSGECTLALCVAVPRSLTARRMVKSTFRGLIVNRVIDTKPLRKSLIATDRFNLAFFANH